MDYLKSNKEAWNEAFGYHKKARKNSLQAQFKDKNFTTFEDSEIDRNLIKKIRELKLEGKNVAHIQTNNGRELISLLRVSGAKLGVGFDISDEAIGEARELSEIAGENAIFECVNIFDIDKKYNEFFDMIYITEGSLSWLPDMNKYFSVMSRILKKGGSILISEIHPVSFVFDTETDKSVDYENKGPYKMTSGLDYVGEIDYTPKDCYWFMHKLSDIFMSMIDNGFEILNFEESNVDTGWIDPENKHPNFPRSFVLVAKKK